MSETNQHEIEYQIPYQIPYKEEALELIHIGAQASFLALALKNAGMGNFFRADSIYSWVKNEAEDNNRTELLLLCRATAAYIEKLKSEGTPNE